MGRILNPLFVTLQEIDKSKGWKSSLELGIVIFCNTSPITSQLHVMTLSTDVSRQFSEEGFSGVILLNRKLNQHIWGPPKGFRE